MTDRHQTKGKKRATCFHSVALLIFSDFKVHFPGGWHRARSHQIVHTWCLWLPKQGHPSLVWAAIAFALIAILTGTSGVTPGVLTTLAARDQVIDGEFVFADKFTTTLVTRVNTTVDAGEVIAF